MSAASSPAEDVPRGAAFMMLAALFFAGMGAAAKAASAELPSTIVVFFRNAVGLLVLLPWLTRRGGPGLATRHFGQHLFRSVTGLAAISRDSVFKRRDTSPINQLAASLGWPQAFAVASKNAPKALLCVIAEAS